MVTVLNVRGECSGGPMLPQVEASRDLYGVDRLTILIHGYNNNGCSAWKAYDGFARLPEVDDGVVAAALGEVCEFFWPGDSRVFGPGSYPFEISRAKAAAELLFDYLMGLGRGRSRPLELQLVCHSLGNRVALEILKRYVDAGRPAELRFVRTLLMAAAVQVSAVEKDDELEPAATACGLSRVLFSTDDAVLHYAFQPGEFLAGEGFGVAVGRFGEPQSGRWTDRVHMVSYGHSDYWATAQTGPQVRAWLGMPAVRTIDSHTIPDAPLPPPNVTDTRGLLSREVGSTKPLCACS